MRTRSGYTAALFLLTVWMGHGPAGWALPLHGPSLQLFSSIDQRAVGVGEPLVLSVLIYASPGTPDEEQSLRRSVEEGRLRIDSLHFKLLRTETGEGVRDVVEGVDVFSLTIRYILRARHAGVIRSPVFEFAHGGKTFRSTPHRLDVYSVSPDFFRAGQSILPIMAETKNGGSPRQIAGTAFLISEDALVTSFHVVVDADRVNVTLPNGQVVTTRKAWLADPFQDIAILHIDPQYVRRARLMPLSMAPDEGNTGPEGGGDVVFTYGWPLGKQRSTAGILYRDVLPQPNERAWISANPLLPGDSGGPLLDRYGRVLAVISSGTVGRGADVLRENVCFATDLHPSLARLDRIKHPRRLKTLFRDQSVEAEPRTHALRVSSYLSIGNPIFPQLIESLAEVQAAARENTGDARLHFMRGAILEMLGNGTEARASYEAALTANPGYFPAAYVLALYDLRQGAYSAAREEFERIHSYLPYRHLASYGLAVSLIGRLEYREAVEHITAVIQYDPHFAPAWFDLARCYLALGDEPRARQIMHRLEEINPRWASHLRQVIRIPALRPITRIELPPANLASLENWH